MGGESSDLKVVCASGGLVWRDTPRGRTVAVVHRTRYDDWCLPKGKLLEKESWQEAALREVKEETGCDAKITGLAGATCYEANGKVKLVLFWSMTPVVDCRFQPSEEVDRMEWLNRQQALDRLDYVQERRLLEENANR